MAVGVLSELVCQNPVPEAWSLVSFTPIIGELFSEPEAWLLLHLREWHTLGLWAETHGCRRPHEELCHHIPCIR